MKATYDLTPNDLVAFVQLHHALSPALRKQRLGCLHNGFLALLILPAFVLCMSGKPLLQTAIDIWPLLLGPVVYLPVVVLLWKWNTGSLHKRMLKEGRNKGFYGDCTLALETDGIHETKSNGKSIRNWAAVEQIVITSQHLFVYTSGTEAFVVPRRAFESDSDFSSFAQQIAERSRVEILRV